MFDDVTYDEMQEILEAGLEKVAYEEGLAEYEDSLVKMADAYDVDPIELHEYLEKVAGPLAGDKPNLALHQKINDPRGAAARLGKADAVKKYMDGKTKAPLLRRAGQYIGDNKKALGLGAAGAAGLAGAGYGAKKLMDRRNEKKKTASAEFEDAIMKVAAVHDFDPVELYEFMNKEAAPIGVGGEENFENRYTDDGYKSYRNQRTLTRAGLGAGLGALGAGLGAKADGGNPLAAAVGGAALGGSTGAISGFFGAPRGAAGRERSANRDDQRLKRGLLGIGRWRQGRNRENIDMHNEKAKTAAAFGLDEETFDVLLQNGLEALS